MMTAGILLVRKMTTDRAFAFVICTPVAGKTVAYSVFSDSGIAF